MNCKNLQVFFAITMSALGVSQSAGLSPDLTKVKIAVNSVFALLDRESKIDPLVQAGKTLKIVRGEVELQHVSFTYPTRPSVPIFKDLNLTVHAGKVQNTAQPISVSREHLELLLHVASIDSCLILLALSVRFDSAQNLHECKLVFLEG
jgi:ABC-type transport system involved in Fe-S cluster assembly fused permease/ATPase subunit